MEIAYTSVDFFGCFGDAGSMATTYHTPTGYQVRVALCHAAAGYTLDAFDSIIVALCQAGF